MSLDAQVRVALGGLDLDVALTVEAGEVLAVLGPNGAGKTTLLRVLAGLVPLAAGRIVLDGVVLDDPGAGIHVPAERRRVGMVFQDRVLFPHLTAVENVAFGLRCRGIPRRAARREAREWLARVGLDSAGDAHPSALSGGQAQRVALARALVTRPRLLLLDEPLAALDATARADVRRELRRHLASFEGIRILVTHDPLEAIALADRLAILEQGRVVQTGSPAEVTERPRSPWVADLVGVNLLRGEAAGGRVRVDGGGDVSVAAAPDGAVFAVVHPRAVALHRRAPEGSPRNVWRGTVGGIDVEADRVRVRVDGRPPVVAEVTRAAANELALAPGVEIWVSVKATEIRAYPA